MSRKHAFLINNVVVDSRAISEQEFAELVGQYDALIDIEDIIPEPQVGWVLQGNKLVLAQADMSVEEEEAYQQTAQRKFGEKLTPQLVDLVGKRNFKLSREGTPANVGSLANSMASIKLLLETGALKTARTVCTSLKPGFPLHADILDFAIASITNFLIENDWN